MALLPKTDERVPQRTARRQNERIQEEIVASVRACAERRSRIGPRLAELDREWDIERAFEANAALVSLLGLGLAAIAGRRLLLVPGLAAGFLLQHALQGWCPPLPLFRRRGFRTHEEIDRERYALKALRGDFAPPAGTGVLSPAEQAEVAIQSVQR